MQKANKIGYLREKRGITQEQLANMVGISRAALSHYEKGRREPDYDTLSKIADFFKVSIDYLVGRTDNPQMVLDNGVGEFVDALELSNEEILKRFSLMIDGRKLTEDEAKRFIAFVRAERSLH